MKKMLFEIVIKALEATNYATVAQLVEQLICNQLVGGSSPSSGSVKKREVRSEKVRVCRVHQVLFSIA